MASRNNIVNSSGYDPNLNGNTNQRTAVPGQSSGTSAFQSVSNFVGSTALKIGEGVGQVVKQGVTDFISDTGFGKALRAVNLLTGANPLDLSFKDGNWGSNNELDWRVRFSVPGNMAGSPLLKPLSETNGLVYPYTPTVMIQSQASYNAIQPIHTNYSFFAYQNTNVASMSFMGEFYVENALEGEYWVAAIHYLRSVTKMAYGRTSNKGSPPPVVRLNGYGDYVFKNVPVIITEFTVELARDVDYIQVGLGANGSWVPTKSTISITAQPIYSRRQVSKFSLDAFARGDYVAGGKGFI